MKLILHIGTHKTGTTAIQRALSQNRATLLEHGYWYPMYNEILKDKQQNYAHLDIAKGLMGESAVLDKSDAISFLSGLYNKAREKQNIHTVIVSGETLLRGKVGAGDKWGNIENFQKLLSHQVTAFSDVEVHVTLRAYIDYLESLYNEHVKATTYSKSIMSFYHEYSERFSYRKIVETWSENVAPVKVTAFSELSGIEMVKKWAGRVLGEQVSNELTVSDTTANLSWKIPLVEIKRKINSLNDRDFSSKCRAVLNKFNGTDYVINNYGKKLTWLSEPQKQKVITQHLNDKNWLVENYNAACIDFCEYDGSDGTRFETLSDQTLAAFFRFNSQKDSD